jgi:serine protease Do
MQATSIISRRKRAAVLAMTLPILLAGVACNGRRREASTETQGARPAPALSSVPLSYADVVEHVAPAVVTVRATSRVRAPIQFQFSGSDWLRRLFGGGLFGGTPPAELERALGSGVIVRANGYILTNQHVIDGAQEIKIDLADHRTFTSKLVGADAPSDLAVLKIDANHLPVLTLGNSDRVRVGDICLAIGNPLGVGQTVTAGIISAKGRRTGLSNGAFEDFIQTDAAINQGNSGGALVDTTGELIGINSRIISTTGGNIGLGFAIPSNMAKNVMDQLIGHGKVVRGHLGVTVQPVTSDLAESLGLKQVAGVLVSGVESGGPAEKAGIHVGDVITMLNGKKIEDANAFRNDVASTAPGTTVDLTVERGGKEMRLRPTLSESPTGAGNPAREAGKPALSSSRLGVTTDPVTPGIASRLGLSPGTRGVVITSINPIGPAAIAGLQPGDVIVEINRTPIRSNADVDPALAKAGSRPSLLLVNRAGQTFFVTAGG